MKFLTRLLLEQEKWDAAIESSDALLALLPEYAGEGNGYYLKALAYRGKKDPAGEAVVLEELSSRTAEAFSAYTRLIDVNFEERNWDGVITNAKRGLAINPFNQRIHYCSGCAHEAKEEAGLAVKSFENALLLDPANPSELRFRLARLLKTEDETKARRYVLDSLADSPRNREAHGLLLEMVEGPKGEVLPGGVEGEESSGLPVSSDPLGGRMAPSIPRKGKVAPDPFGSPVLEPKSENGSIE